jgi:hypothetical protein
LRLKRPGLIRFFFFAAAYCYKSSKMLARLAILDVASPSIATDGWLAVLMNHLNLPDQSPNSESPSTNCESDPWLPSETYIEVKCRRVRLQPSSRHTLSQRPNNVASSMASMNRGR